MPNLPRLRRARETDLLKPDSTEPETHAPRVEEISSGGLRWNNSDSPGGEERAWLEENFDFHALDIEDVLSHNQRPKIDEYPDYLFLVVHVPVFDRKAKRLVAGEIDIFVGPDFMVTLPNQAIPPVEYLFERCRADDTLRHKLFARGSGYLMYRLVDDSFDYCFPMLRKIGNKLERLEDSIFEGESEKIVRDISDTKQEIITFRKIVRPQRAALADLERTKRYIPEDLEIYFDDINDAGERIWDMLENFKEVIEGIEDTNESIVQHRLNDTFRILTVISVVFLPLTLIASIWGMNSHVPGEQSVEGFWIVVAIMVVVLAGMLGFFKKRGWL